jgi:hypothetical protein
LYFDTIKYKQLFSSKKNSFVDKKKQKYENSIKIIPRRLQNRIIKKIERKRNQRSKFKMQISEKMTPEELILFEKCKETKIFKESCVFKLLKKFKNISELNFDFGTKKKKNLAMFINYFLSISIK